MRIHRPAACVLAAAALSIAPLLAAAPAAATVSTTQAAQDAYVYGIPIMEFLRTARQQTSVTVPDQHSDAPVNQLGNARTLSNATEHVIVQPNNDTPYTMGHVNLAGGPLVLHVPAVPNHRYYSFEFMDPYTNVYAYVGTRATGDGAGNFLIVGPRWHGRVPHGLRVIRSPYQLTWLAGRTLAYGPSDLPEVHRIQNGYQLVPLGAYERVGLRYRPPRPRHIVTTPTRYAEPTGLAFFDRLGDALKQSPPPARDHAILSELATIGVGPGRHPSSEHLPAATVAALQAAVAGGPAAMVALKTQVAAPSVLANDGWFVPPPDIAAYGTDYKLRAVVAINGLAANRPVEAMYIVGVMDSTHAYLNGSHTYTIHFPAGQLPPARYFWSLTMYDSSFYLVANPLNRYEIGNRTAGLHYNADGSLDIYLGATAPPGHESNWLPSPASGQFQVTLRLYGPEASALHRTYHYPPIVRTG